jgi:transposase
MEERIKREYVKRSQKDYSMSFKLDVVREIERMLISVKGAQRKYGIQGNATITQWLRKYGTFDWENQTPSHMPKSPEQKIMELEQKVKLLEKQKSFLEKQVETADKKAIIFDMMIDLAEKEFNIPIRKKCLPEQLTITGKNKKKL